MLLSILLSNYLSCEVIGKISAVKNYVEMSACSDPPLAAGSTGQHSHWQQLPLPVQYGSSSSSQPDNPLTSSQVSVNVPSVNISANTNNLSARPFTSDNPTAVQLRVQHNVQVYNNRSSEPQELLNSHLAQQPYIVVDPYATSRPSGGGTRVRGDQVVPQSNLFISSSNSNSSQNNTSTTMVSLFLDRFFLLKV